MVSLNRELARSSKAFAAAASMVDWLSTKMAVFAGIVSLIMCLMITAEVIMRYFFNRPSLWVDEISGYMMLAIGCLGLSYTTLVRGHLNMDMVISRFRKRVQAAVEIVTSFLFAATFSMLWSWGGCVLILERYADKSHSLLRLPLLPMYILLAVGGLTLLMQLLVQIGRAVSVLLSNSQEAPNQDSTNR